MFVPIRLFVGLASVLTIVVLATSGCGGSASSSTPAPVASTSSVSPSATSLSSSTTGPPPSTANTLTSTPQGLRIGVMIPTEILYRGRLYVGGASISEAGKAVPADLSLVGSAAAASEDGKPIAGGSYGAYAIKGIDPRQTIALEFMAASKEGPVFAWISYRRK